MWTAERRGLNAIGTEDEERRQLSNASTRTSAIIRKNSSQSKEKRNRSRRSWRCDAEGVSFMGRRVRDGA